MYVSKQGIGFADFVARDTVDTLLLLEKLGPPGASAFFVFERRRSGPCNASTVV